MRGNPKIVIIIIFAAFLIGGVIFYLFQKSSQYSSNLPAPSQLQENKSVSPPTDGLNGAKKEKMKLSSSAFDNNQMIPKKYTCDGDDINPPLLISDVPQNAKSLVLIIDDPDAPQATWVHWTVFNISPKTVQIPENNVPPEAREGTTSFGKPGYGGPCPPSGIHHYYFKLYALDSSLNLDSSAKKEDIENAIQGHIIEQAELIGLYKR